MDMCLTAGKIVDGKLLLTPIAGCLQLRPDLSHLDVVKEKAAAGGKRGAADMEDEEEDVKPQLQAVKVELLSSFWSASAVLVAGG